MTLHQTPSSRGFRSAFVQTIQMEYNMTCGQMIVKKTLLAVTQMLAVPSLLTDVFVCSTKNSLEFFTLKII
jgi:hypothetical protein